MVFTGGKGVKIDVDLDTTGADEGFRKLGKDLDGVEREAKKASGVLQEFARGLTQGLGIGVATAAIRGLNDAFSLLPEAISRGSDVADITESFNQLATSAGVSGDALINDFSAALGGTIPKVDAMKQANELLLGGLDPSKFDLVAQAARKFADVTGTDAAGGMNALTDSLLRGNDKALKNIGIVVDNEKAYRDFAKEIGTTADQLSESGKVAATQQAVLGALEKKMGELGGVTNDAGDNLSALSAAIQDQKDKAFLAIGTNVELNNALAGIVETVRNVDFAPLIDGLSNVLSVTLKLGGEGLAALGNFTGGLKDMIGFYSKVETINQGKSGSFFNPFASFEQAAKSLVFEKLTKATTDFVGKGLKPLTDNLLKTGSAADKVTKSTKDYIKPNDDAAKASKKAADEAAKHAEKLQELKEKLNSLDGLLQYKNKLEQTFKATYDNVISAERLGEEIRKLRAEFEAGGGNVEDFDRALGAAADSFKDVGKEAEKAARDVKTFGESLEDAVASGIGNILEGDFEGGLKNIGSSLGASLGSSFGPIGTEIGSFLGEKLGKAVFDGIDHIFGGRDAQGKIRDSLDKLFADALKDNPALIQFEGELKRITDLEFLRGTDSFENGTFDDFLAGLSDKAREAFNGIASGFSEVFGQGAELSGQLAAILANNLGGSLNNLQLLVEATGKSFEDLRKGVVEAFLDGKLSALEAQTALNGIAQIAQKGIPDGIGKVDTAFENLKNSGVKGGRALIDALQDIGFEASELGDKTLEQVMKRLEATGKFSSKEIQQVFDALKKNGINSVEDLKKATAEQLLPVLSQLQASGFGFKEQAKEVKEYVDAVNSIPERKSVVIDLKVNATSQDKDIVVKLAGGPGVPSR